jgi:hypothetical protein
MSWSAGAPGLSSRTSNTQVTVEPRGRREPETTTIDLPARRHPGRLTKVRRVDCVDRILPVELAATGEHGQRRNGIRPGNAPRKWAMSALTLPSNRDMPMSTPPPRHLPSPPRHLTSSRWPWRLLLVAFGLTTGVLAALVASATLLPQPAPPSRAPALALSPAVPTEPALRPAPTTAPSRTTTTPDTGPRASVGRPPRLDRSALKRRPRLARP